MYVKAGEREFVEEEVRSYRRQAEDEIRHAEDLDELDRVRVRYLGKKGLITKVLRSMGDLPPEDRPVIGRLANKTRSEIETLIEEREAALAGQERKRRLREEAVDISLPGRRPPIGGRHPLSLVRNEIELIFRSMGFEVAEGPEVETDYYNFESLNIPKDHPARDMQDSFYITDDILLRTQTSAVQVRYMESRAPELPIRIIAPGRTFRRDDDATHSPVFHQLEGLLVDETVTFGDLKGILLRFARSFFGEETEIRLRPSYFPFTEPSAEVDVSCSVCGGPGCRTCGDKGWIEILGAGLVHPKVLENGGYDPEEVSGLAFGMGLERIAMLKFRIDDLRLFFQNDLRFLRQFS